MILLVIVLPLFGMFLNLLVIFANNGMPVVSLRESVGHWIPLTPDTQYVYLSDIYSIDKIYFSIGDLVIFIGLVLTTYFLFKWLFRKKEVPKLNSI